MGYSRTADFNWDSAKPLREALEMPGDLGHQPHPSLGPNVVEGGGGGMGGGLEGEVSGLALLLGALSRSGGLQVQCAGPCQVA